MWRYILPAGVILVATVLTLQHRAVRDPVPVVRRALPVTAPAHRKPQDNEPFEYKELEAQQKDMEALEPDPPAGATAQCVDMTYSFVKRKEDACRDHRGIYKWLADIPPHYK